MPSLVWLPTLVALETILSWFPTGFLRDYPQTELILDIIYRPKYHLIMQTKEQIIERFWNKVDKSAGEDGCWLWKAGTITRGVPGHRGYGNFWLTHTTSVRAHRFVWELIHGPIPQGMEVCHTCDHESCVNPKHLFLGTQADNISDSVAKGRQVDNNGEKNGMAKLTANQIREIRKSNLKREILATQFNVSKEHINSIQRRACWKNI